MPATLFDIQKKYGESVYPLYKNEMHEPYMENVIGEGYQGVVLYDEIEDKVQCAECGKWFSQLQVHLKYVHKMNTYEYRDRFGILQNASLTSKALSQLRSETSKATIKKYPNLLIPHNPNWFQKLTKTERSEHMRKANNGHQKVGFKNKKGLCDAQIAARIIIVKDMCGGVQKFSGEQIKKYDPKLFGALVVRHGSIGKAFKNLNLKSHNNTRRYEDSVLIAALRKYVFTFGRIPRAKEWKEKSTIMKSDKTWRDHFGSWRRTKMMAGLKPLLEEMDTAVVNP